MMAPVSRIMVRQVQSRANAGTFTNGMPMTSSMGCGVWGGQHHQREHQPEALHERDLGQPADCRRSAVEQELFGEFYNSRTFDPVAVPQ
jgi:sulfoacetaldehyde dehydrogenase